MQDFCDDYVDTYKNGQPPKWDYPANDEGTLRAVVHDNTARMYCIFKADAADFVEWVALKWQKDNDLIGDDESAEDYLDRIDVRIVSKPSRCKPRRTVGRLYAKEGAS